MYIYFIYEGNLNPTIPGHLTSQVSSTIYKAVPSLATSGVKYNSTQQVFLSFNDCIHYLWDVNNEY